MKSILKAILLFALILSAVITCEAQSENHCIPKDESEFLHERLIMSYTQEVLIDTLESKIVILSKGLESEKRNSRDVASKQNMKINILIAQVAAQAQVSSTFERDSKHWRSSYKKVKLIQPLKILLFSAAAFGAGMVYSEFR